MWCRIHLPFLVFVLLGVTGCPPPPAPPVASPQTLLVRFRELLQLPDDNGLSELYDTLLTRDTRERYSYMEFFKLFSSHPLGLTLKDIALRSREELPDVAPEQTTCFLRLYFEDLTLDLPCVKEEGSWVLDFDHGRDLPPYRWPREFDHEQTVEILRESGKDWNVWILFNDDSKREYPYRVFRQALLDTPQGKEWIEHLRGEDPQVIGPRQGGGSKKYYRIITLQGSDRDRRFVIVQQGDFWYLKFSSQSYLGMSRRDLLQRLEMTDDYR